LHSALSAHDEAEEHTKVLLVSFMRDLAFWNENARRQGLDLDRLALKRRFAFVDGLSELFLPKQKSLSKTGVTILSDSGMSSVEGDIQKALQGLSEGGGKVILVLDQLDLLLATAGERIGAVEVGDVLLGLREV
jgi:elongator complex protein 6